MAPEDIYGLFGRRVLAQRLALGLSQDALSKRVGLSRASIANIEAGRQRVLLHQALGLAFALGARSLADLFSIDLSSADQTEPLTKRRFSGSRLSAEEEERLTRLIESA